ncbi:MAG TPA: helix-turn-helix domain-containing protein [Steroidobacteraceae bacterium]|nr:helix-turn-helix domain-containing protein [Steroidobacteraceae bacterium]
MKTVSLAERLADHTEQLILDAAVRLLESTAVAELTIRAVAQRAHISERTVFRYFATREAFLDAVAAEVSRRFELPPSPDSIAGLVDFPDALYRRFEANSALTRAALHSELFDRMLNAPARQRWLAIGKLIDAHAPRRSERERRFAAANIRHFLSATTWHYYRFYFGFSLDDTIECAKTAIRQAVAGLENGRRK